ncbi:hypothetical protein AOZ06_33800 [Kibdelosporangium phytohabitans]|uniref:LysR substrate-binding domain-containing protein n=1 Tax=Kibdelosporangium phytohabitans TaxID=860235 RepID=A0A0N9I8U4_9PSEU|nr:hypothetical protein AOZ06_33800 [Kibdelosporangium phytohabitans]
MRQDLSAMSDGVAGTLRIGAIPTTLTVAPLLTSPFCARHPRARVAIESLSEKDVAHRFTEFDLDVGMTYLDGEALGRARAFPLYAEKYLCSYRSRTSWPNGEWPAGRTRPSSRCACCPSRCATAASSTRCSRPWAPWLCRRSRPTPLISHAWLNMFGVPQGMRAVPLQQVRPSSQGHTLVVISDKDGPGSAFKRELADGGKLAGTGAHSYSTSGE